jgi:hypothetical protein
MRCDPLVVVLVCVIAACGSQASQSQDVAPVTGGGPPAASDAAPPVTRSAAPPTDAGAGPPTAPPGRPPAFDAGFTPDATAEAGGGDSTSIARLFPAVVGHSWTFQISSDFPECDGVRSGAVLGQQNVDGRNAFVISSYCDGVSPSAVSVSDKSADVDFLGVYIPQLAAPVTEGASFASIEGTTTWHKEGAVTVPAGTFQDCWRAVSGATFVVYCPGVGTVIIHEDTGDGVIDARLMSKNF